MIRKVDINKEYVDDMKHMSIDARQKPIRIDSDCCRKTTSHENEYLFQDGSIQFLLKVRFISCS